MINRIWKIFRAIVVGAVILVVGVPAAVYMVVSTEWAQRALCQTASTELSALLATEVDIERVQIHPFDRVSVYGVMAKDDYGQRALGIKEVSAGIELWHLLRTGQIVIDYALVDGADIVLYKKTPDSPLNIANILDRLRSKDKKKPPTRFELRINTVILRNAAMSYDIHSLGRRQGFDPNHIRLTGLDLHAYIPKLSNDCYAVELDHLGFHEACGFNLKHLGVKAEVRTSGIALNDLTVELPQTRILFDPLQMSFERFEQIPAVLRSTPTAIGIQRGSYVWLPDLAAFVPALGRMDLYTDLSLKARATLNSVQVSQLYLSDRLGAATLQLQGTASGLRNADSLKVDLRGFNLEGHGPTLARELQRLQGVKPAVARIIAQLENYRLALTAKGRPCAAALQASLSYGPGRNSLIDIDGSFRTADRFRSVDFDASAELGGVNAGQLSTQRIAGLISGRIKVSGHIAPKVLEGNVDADFQHLQLMGYDYHDVKLMAQAHAGKIGANLDSRDYNTNLKLEGEFGYADAVKHLVLDGQLRRLDLHALNLSKRYPGYTIGGTVSANLSGSNIDDITGYAHLDNLSLVGPDRNLDISRFNIDVERDGDSANINIDSDILQGRVGGQINFSSLGSQLKDCVAIVLPDLMGRHPLPEAPVLQPFADGHDADAHQAVNRFDYTLQFDRLDRLSEFFRIPLRANAPIKINGSIDSRELSAALNIEVPALLNGDKTIDRSALMASIDGPMRQATLYATTHMPTKKGPMSLVLNMDAAYNRVNSHIDWRIDRRTPVAGQINFSTLLGKTLNSELKVDVDLNRSQITLGEDLWTLQPAAIHYTPGRVAINGFGMFADNQSLQVSGIVGSGTDDSLEATLKNFQVSNIFKSLEIESVALGGRLTGQLTGSALLSGNPLMRGQSLRVADISYNGCVLGDADLLARYDVHRKAVHLEADITSEQDYHNSVYGDIFVANGGGLDLNFKCQRVKVGLLRPFLAGFTTGVSGHASGWLRLFGTFKDLDIEGDVKAENFGMRVGFTNVWYYSSDSVIMRSGRIIMPDMRIRDAEGHTARLNGEVRHRNFRNLNFDIAVTDARGLLCYDVDGTQSPSWHGRVYGNGTTFIKGDDAAVNINVNMTSAPNSRFTFVIVDQKDAADYSFMTFRPKPGTEQAVSAPAPKVASSGSAVNLDMNLDLNPNVALNILLNPQSGDEIKAVGNGNVRLFYGSRNNDLYVYGNYTVDRGSYRFTLQDIILKDFTIDQGSTISFHGDPYNPRLNLQAVYQVNANLTDLDESFMFDKEINRTNVPVHALLFVKGDLMQPDIKFDLQFPTLNEDVYRKVRSIVSTEDMMNRQIFYLLALNRFYTPEYMASTTKGNEMFSVASSTISSQLSSMLGKLSDQWSIAPNLRSDRGDFSDVEVDVALSSRLLNNRLLFNGNFGYRDKTISTNQFVGDFDVQYLLTRQGDIRLKAYNRYNDQNYFLRTAMTTQGLGLMLRHDFDDLRSLWPFKRRKLSLLPDSVQ